MSQDFTVTKKVKETKDGTTITVDIKKVYSTSTTISGDIEDVVDEIKKLTNKDEDNE